MKTQTKPADFTGTGTHVIPGAVAPVPSALKKGDRVDVWENPVEAKNHEGTAVLVKKELAGNWDYYPNGINEPPRLLELWAVRFDGEQTIRSRKVSPSDKL